MNNLEIDKKINGGEIILTCTGRLDANHSGHLNDYIDRLVRERQYHIALDLDGIEYLSSAGIRTLVNQHKNLKSVNGYFYIAAMSDNVKQVLEMVGLACMLGEVPVKRPISETTDKKQNTWESDGFHLNITPLDAENTTPLQVSGNPDLVKTSKYTRNNSRNVKSEEKMFALGLGAIGESFDECKNNFGEYLMFGKNIAYLPADGSKKPDYMMSSGKLVATLTELYGLHFIGNFSNIVHFEPTKSANSITLSCLVESICKHFNYNEMAMVMIAESDGLIGTSLNKSPVDGNKIFTYPEVKDAVNFTTEPAHVKKLSLSVGYFSSTGDKKSTAFLRRLTPNSTFSGHIHSAVFPYIPLKKTDIDLEETIEFLFENSGIIDILHLTNDSRKIVGLGESQFVQGVCWIVPVTAINQINNQ